HVCHRDLHSFPTRRSSDLKDSRKFDFFGGNESPSLFRNLDDFTCYALIFRLNRCSIGFSRSILPLKEPFKRISHSRFLTRIGTLDRKSTRLNSSHVKTSYA